MAFHNICCDAPAVACVAVTAKTVVMATAPANIAVRVKEARFTFDGATSTATPPTIELGRPSTAGTFTSVTLRNRDPGRTETIQTTGGKNASAEPTWTSVVDETLYEPAYGGVYHYITPQDNPIILTNSGRYGARVTAPANVNCSSKLELEE